MFLSVTGKLAQNNDFYDFLEKFWRLRHHYKAHFFLNITERNRFPNFANRKLLLFSSYVDFIFGLLFPIFFERIKDCYSPSFAGLNSFNASEATNTNAQTLNSLNPLK